MATSTVRQMAIFQRPLNITFLMACLVLDPTATVSTNHDTSHGTQQDYESTEKSRTSGSALGHSQNGISGDLAEEEEGIQVESEADVYYEHI